MLSKAMSNLVLSYITPPLFDHQAVIFHIDNSIFFLRFRGSVANVDNRPFLLYNTF